MIASAVVVPEPEPDTNRAAYPPLKKRRQSSLSSNTSVSKRLRLDESTQGVNSNALEANSASPVASVAPKVTPVASDRRKSATNVSERQRTRRLFGALLGPAAKPATAPSISNAAQQRRLDAEKKHAARQVELAAQAGEDARALQVRREAEQKLWDEDGRRLLWENDRQRAGFLRTKGAHGESVIYWRPWDMTQDQKKLVADQIEEVEARIVSEGGAVKAAVADNEKEEMTEDNYARPSKATVDDAVLGQEGETEHITTGSEPGPISSNAETVDAPEAAIEATLDLQIITEPPDVSKEKEPADELEGEEADVVVEAGEDAVIY